MRGYAGHLMPGDALSGAPGSEALLCPLPSVPMPPQGAADCRYVWASFFTDWTFVVFGFSGFFGCAVTVLDMRRMTSRARSGQTHSAEQTQSTPQMAGAEPDVLQPSVQQALPHQFQTSPQRQVHRQLPNDCVQATSPDTAVRNPLPDVEGGGTRLPPPRCIRKVGGPCNAAIIISSDACHRSLAVHSSAPLHEEHNCRLPTFPMNMAGDAPAWAELTLEAW